MPTSISPFSPGKMFLFPRLGGWVLIHRHPTEKVPGPPEAAQPSRAPAPLPLSSIHHQQLLTPSPRIPAPLPKPAAPTRVLTKVELHPCLRGPKRDNHRRVIEECKRNESRERERGRYIIYGMAEYE